LILMAAQKHLGHAVVIPCGLMYVHRAKSRQPVVLEFGEPLSFEQVVSKAEIKVSTIIDLSRSRTSGSVSLTH
jgi:hypothetical protein